MIKIQKYNNYDIYEIEDFVDKSFCSNVIDWFSGQKKTHFNDNSFWSSRTINYNRINNTSIKKIIAKHRIDRTVIVQNIFKKMLYPDYTDIVYWPNGIEMDSHIDDGNSFHYRKYSSVLYLNDNYTGGHTYFKDLEIDVVPKQGKLIVYPSSENYAHGVSKVEGDRYTLSMWFTTDTEHIEV